MSNSAIALSSSYVIDGGISFQELMATSNDSNDMEHRCLISKEKLDYTRIKLHCNHCFNYVALYNHLTTCKKNKGYLSNTIECPYCREVTQHVLPMYYDPHKRVVLKTGVNSPSKNVLPGYNCIGMSTACACQGAITPIGILCKKHYQSHQKKEARAAEVLKKKEARAAEVLKKKEAKAVEVLKKKEAKAAEVLKKKEAKAAEVLKKKEARAAEVLKKKEARAAEVLKKKEAKAAEVLKKKDAKKK